MYCGMEASHSLYTVVYSSAGVSNLMTDPSERSGLRMGRLAVFGSILTRKRSEESCLISLLAKSNSRLKSAINTGPWMIASVIGLEISDFPPPETVQGLWQSVGSAPVPTSRHERLPGGFSMWTL